jgi:hypothetical protein
MWVDQISIPLCVGFVKQAYHQAVNVSEVWYYHLRPLINVSKSGVNDRE